MGYIKKTLILNEVTKGFGFGVVKGIATIEQINDNAKCFIEIFNLKDISKGIFAFGVASDTSSVYTQRLGTKGKISAAMQLGEIDLKGNLYCVLCYISDENVIPIAWGANNAKKLWETNILDGFKHIVRPPMFAGEVEKVEFKKEQLVQKPKTAQSVQSAGALRQYSNLNQSNLSQNPKTIAKDAYFDKPLAVPKVTIAKVSKVIDEAQKEYDDNQISQTSYYPQDIKPRDILKESAAAAKAVQDALAQPKFYKAFEETPQELVDGYKDYDSGSKNKFVSSSVFKKPEYINEESERKAEELESEKDDLFKVYYYQDDEQDYENADYNPPYIKSWVDYNSIKVKHKEGQKEQKEPENESTNGQPKYYLSVKDELDKLFQNNPPEERLNSIMPDTYWVRVDIGQNQYYVVGLIGEGPDYIGYGVPGIYSVNPPKELQGYCKWLALDKNNPKGEGYWMMYQDADSGQSINLDLI